MQEQIKNPQLQKIKYSECNKGGYHEGENLNYVLLTTQKKEELLGCALCAEENPQKKNEWRPLKIVLNNINNKFLKKKNQPPINLDEIMSEIDMHEKTTISQIDAFQQKLIEKISLLKDNTISYFQKIKDQILTQGKEQAINELINNIYEFSTEEESFKNSLLKLMNVFPQQVEMDGIAGNDLDDKQIEITTESLRQNISSQIKDYSKQIEKYVKDYEAAAETFNQQLNTQIQNLDIIGTSSANYYFSQTLKHQQITTVSKYLIRSTGVSPNYRFALLEPELPSNKITKIAFRIKLGNVANNNWIALGICYKNIVQAKNYSFQFNQLGHGAYMISSNGGSWSNSIVTANNCIKSFGFGKNDVIIIEYDPLEKLVKFTKDGKPENQYKLELMNLENENVCACVLFYYLLDEIEYVHDYKFQ